MISLLIRIFFKKSIHVFYLVETQEDREIKQDRETCNYPATPFSHPNQHLHRKCSWQAELGQAKMKTRELKPIYHKSGWDPATETIMAVS